MTSLKLRGFISVWFSHTGGKQEVIPVVQSADNPEYDITSLVKRKNRWEEKSRVCNRTRRSGLNNPSVRYRGVLNQQYSVTSVDLKTTAVIDPSIAALIIMAPKKNVFRKAINSKLISILWTAVMQLFYRQIAPNFQQQVVMGNEIKTNLADLLFKYGINIAGSNKIFNALQCRYSLRSISDFCKLSFSFR